jgi:hypothetical protein
MLKHFGIGNSKMTQKKTTTGAAFIILHRGDG